MASKNYLDDTGLAYFLTKLASWIPSWFPSIAGERGKFLANDGLTLFWASPPSVTIDSALDSSSTNPVQNAVVTNALANFLKQSSASLAQDGYIALENGLCLQWGHASEGTVTFSVPFTQYPTVIASANALGYPGGYAVTNPSLTSFSLYCVGSSSWFAVGVWK